MCDEISLDELKSIEDGERNRVILITRPSEEPFTRKMNVQSDREIAEYVREYHPGAHWEEI